MLSRSQESHNAAMFLMQSRHYTCSVVAMYYSVLQRMMYALATDEIRPISYEEQNPPDGTIHRKVLTEIKNRIPIAKEANSFKELFENLYILRKKADYQSENISQDECAQCRNIYDGLKSRLNRFFPVR